MHVLNLCLPPARWDPRTLDSKCRAILPDVDEFLPILPKLEYLYRINGHLTPPIPVLTLCLPSARRRPTALDPSVVAILPDFDEFLRILSKLNYLYRFIPHPTLPMHVLTLCLPLARWGHRTLDSQCSGNIARFRWISSNFVKTRPFTPIQPASDHSNTHFNPLSPTCWPRTQGLRFPV